ncbi:hypothetical protein M7I_6710 [Glarea lozoyensis 74030]|nr:hypothetical protein M7I_6710 [Glarea lozoyensis 74030]
MDRGRAYATSDKLCGLFLAGPKGKKHLPGHGCPVFSLGEPHFSEMMLPKGYKVIIDWFQEVAGDPDYANPEMRNETRDMNGNIVDSDDEDEPEDRKGWKAEDFEEWVPLDEQKGVVLEEIKGEDEESKVTLDTKENVPDNARTKGLPILSKKSEESKEMPEGKGGEQEEKEVQPVVKEIAGNGAEDGA